MTECEELSICECESTAQRLTSDPRVQVIVVDDGVLNISLEASVSKAFPDTNSYTLRAGDIAVVFPNTRYEYSPGGIYNCDSNCASCDSCDENGWCSLSKMPFCKMTAYCASQSLLGDIAAGFAHTRPTFPVIRGENVHKDVPYCLEALKAHFKTSKGVTTLAASALIRGYLSIVMSRIVGQIEIVRSESGADSAVMREVFAYLEQYYSEKLTLSSVARKVGVNKYALSRRFETEFGCNFNTLLNSIRVSHAKKLLIATEKSVQDIMYSSGFESECTFYRVFKAICSLTPKQFRKVCGAQYA
ncbi:hypothetical protein FACS1894133_5100 [Clostridia bacterium]|nr:hypothetical protein FACS1894133_5100 [Clostridia bacterium]